MSFLGPTTHLDGRLIRPHDVDVSRTAETGSVEAAVTRVLRIGFEVRIDTIRGDETTTVQLTRKEATQLDLREGDSVWLSPSPGATTVETSVAAPAPAVDADPVPVV
jgi:sulfate transport system ATP-binding protein